VTYPGRQICCRSMADAWSQHGAATLTDLIILWFCWLAVSLFRMLDARSETQWTHRIKLTDMPFAERSEGGRPD
jgi:hypothetical protein